MKDVKDVSKAVEKDERMYRPSEYKELQTEIEGLKRQVESYKFVLKDLLKGK